MADPVRPWRRPPPPPPDPSSLPRDLVARTKALRLRLGDPAGGGSEARRRARTDYDYLLVQVADLLELPGAPDPDLVIGRRILTTLERSLLERDVVAAGVDIGVRHPPRPRALNPGVQPDRRPGPPPRSEPIPPRPSPVPAATSTRSPREQLVALAKGMRRRLDLYEKDDRLWPTKVQEWCEDFDTYDGVLVDLAPLVGVPAASLPEGDRRRLLSEERVALEAGLARAGVDLGTSQDGQLPASPN
ncbi:hypothetical protein BH24ACT1_BH24ACT1_01730 [soil metagenome]